MNFTAIAALMYASTPLAPYEMAQHICQTSSDRIDSDACLQTTFDTLASAETSARVNERLTGVESDAAAKAIGTAATALMWAIENSIDVLSKEHNETVRRWFW